MNTYISLVPTGRIVNRPNGPDGSWCGVGTTNILNQTRPKLLTFLF